MWLQIFCWGIRHMLSGCPVRYTQHEGLRAFPGLAAHCDSHTEACPAPFAWV